MNVCVFLLQLEKYFQRLKNPRAPVSFCFVCVSVCLLCVVFVSCLACGSMSEGGVSVCVCGSVNVCICV